MSYSLELTENGAAKIAAAIVGGPKVDFKEMIFSSSLPVYSSELGPGSPTTIFVANYSSGSFIPGFRGWAIQITGPEDIGQYDNWISGFHNGVYLEAGGEDSLGLEGYFPATYSAEYAALLVPSDQPNITDGGIVSTGIISGATVHIDPTIVNEVARETITSVTTEENTVTLQALLDGASGGFYIRSVYVSDLDSVIIAAARFPETYKPAGFEGGASVLTVNAKINLASVEEGVTVISEDAEGSVRYDIPMTLDAGEKSQARENIGLDEIDNTSDVDKPISTAQQEALDEKANLSGGNTISGAQTLTGQVELTGQAMSDADSALTAGFGLVLPPSLRGTLWDVVQGGSPLVFGPSTSANSGFYARQFGLLNSSADIGGTLGTHVYFHSSVTGLGYSCAHTGSANTGHRGCWFTSSCDTPAAVYPKIYPSFAKKVQVARVRIPTAANRAGRIYQLLTGYTYSGSVEVNVGGVKLAFNGSSNTLNCYVCTSYPATFAAAQTTTGALASPASGTFTAYAVSDATRDMLIRRTQIGAAITVEIAPYSTTPSWTTVLSMTGTDTLPAFGFSVGPDGSASGAAAAVANTMEIITAWEAVKF